jgi:AbrB family looped-hinge helix DNA binding protein
VQLGSQGRFVIPARLRRMLGFEPGNALVIRIEDDRLILEKPEAIKRRLKPRFAKLPKGASLVNQLLAERRKETKKEDSI